jgi:hypothetical protein
VVEEPAAQEQNGHGTEHLSVEQLIQQEVQQAADRTQQTFLSMNTVGRMACSCWLRWKMRGCAERLLSKIAAGVMRMRRTPLDSSSLKCRTSSWTPLTWSSVSSTRCCERRSPSQSTRPADFPFVATTCLSDWIWACDAGRRSASFRFSTSCMRTSSPSLRR